MRLLTKYHRVNLLTTVLVMLITGIVYYQVISLTLVSQVDKDLVVEENEVFDHVKLNHQLPQEFESKDQQISFVPATPGSVKRRFVDTTYLKSEEDESGRGLISSVTVGSKYYKVVIVESKVETEDLIQLIFFITFGLVLLLLLVLFLINRLVLNRLWQPFYSILNQLKGFSVVDKAEIQPIITDTDEFNELNTEVSAMALRVKNDYKNLKTFTENASHELLTPIAVINSKLDTLVQTDNFTSDQSKLLDDLYNSVSRLNRLNRTLLLLVKLENNLESEQAAVDLKLLFENMLAQFDEIYSSKKLAITTNLSDKEITLSHTFFEILLSNLLNNAYRHNYTGGAIHIALTAESLTIANTGETTALEVDKIFTRFYKSPGSEGNGLGLTICRQICENLGFTMAYNFENDMHRFTLFFNA